MIRAWWERRTPRQILVAGFVVFLIYAWPGFIGWDSREHLLHARDAIYGDAHPPAVARLWRLVELVIAGPTGMLLAQAIPLLAGLYRTLRLVTTERRAAVVASLVFGFPLIAGVTALICKDALMAGPLVLGIALLAEGKRGAGLAWLFAGSLMRWNSFPATFAPIVLLVQWRGWTGWRRYTAAALTWFATSFASLEVNEELLTATPEYSWYETHAVQDIAGTLQYVDDLDDATLGRILDGIPLRVHDRLHQRFRERYDPADYRHLNWGPNRMIDKPRSEAERAATGRAWRELVFGHPTAYLKFRLDNFRILTNLDRFESFSNVYVWFAVIAAPETIAELEHDASASRVQQRLIEASVWISLTPVYFVFIYLALTLVLLPLARTRLELALLLSGLGYELAWFFFAPTTDVRYSQWMVLCSVLALSAIVLRRRAR